MIISNSSWSLQFFLSKSCLSFTVHTHQNQSLNTRNRIGMHLILEKWKTLLFVNFWPNIFPILLSNNAKNKIKAKPQCHAMNIPSSTRVESSLLQIDPALCWNFSQTILNFIFWHPLFWLVLFLVLYCVLVYLLFCFDFKKMSGGKVPPMSWVNLK